MMEQKRANQAGLDYYILSVCTVKFTLRSVDIKCYR